jgi:hypothetical protein
MPLLYIRVVLALAIAAALIGGYFTWEHHERNIGRAEIQKLWDADRVQWQAALDKQKAAAVMQLAAETKKAIDAEQRLNEFRNTQEKTDASHISTVAGLRAELARGGLRDPGAKAPGRGSGGGGPASAPAAPADAGAASGAEAGGVLSAQFAGMLLDRASEADTINNAYASCRAAAMNDRAAP